MLQGHKIALGPVLPADFDTLLRWADDPQLAGYSEAYRPPLWRQQEDFWFARSQDAARLAFAMRHSAQSPILGYVLFWHIDAIHRSALLGMLIGDPARRGQGYGEDALRLSIAYAWQHLNLRRLTLHVFASNTRALRLYERCGFIREGHLRQAVYIAGRYEDVVLMGMLREEL